MALMYMIFGVCTYSLRMETSVETVLAPSKVACAALCFKKGNCKMLYFNQNDGQCQQLMIEKQTQVNLVVEQTTVMQKGYLFIEPIKQSVKAEKRLDTTPRISFPRFELDKTTIKSGCCLDRGYFTYVKTKTGVCWKKFQSKEITASKGLRCRVAATRSIKGGVSFWAGFAESKVLSKKSSIFSFLLTNESPVNRGIVLTAIIKEYQQSSVKLEVWTSNRKYASHKIINNCKHGNQFNVSVGFLLNWPKRRLSIIDLKSRVLIYTTMKMDTSCPMLPMIDVSPQRKSATNVTYVTGDKLQLDEITMRLLRDLTDIRAG